MVPGSFPRGLLLGRTGARGRAELKQRSEGTPTAFTRLLGKGTPDEGGWGRPVKNWGELRPMKKIVYKMRPHPVLYQA